MNVSTSNHGPIAQMTGLLSNVCLSGRSSYQTLLLERYVCHSHVAPFALYTRDHALAEHVSICTGAEPICDAQSLNTTGPRLEPIAGGAYFWLHDTYPQRDPV